MGQFSKQKIQLKISQYKLSLLKFIYFPGLNVFRKNCLTYVKILLIYRICKAYISLLYSIFLFYYCITLFQGILQKCASSFQRVKKSLSHLMSFVDLRPNIEKYEKVHTKYLGHHLHFHLFLSLFRFQYNVYGIHKVYRVQWKLVLLLLLLLSPTLSLSLCLCGQEADENCVSRGHTVPKQSYLAYCTK